MEYSNYEENGMLVDTLMAAEKEKQKQVDEASSVASQFSQYFHDMLEKKPHLVGQLYLEDSIMLWDGNPIFSRDGIQKFIELQLPSLTFNVTSMDCQSLSSTAVGSKKSFMITLGGLYRISGVGTVKPFSRQIIITTDCDKWRIATDNFRSQK